MELICRSASELGLALSDEVLEKQEIQLLDPLPLIDGLRRQFGFGDGLFEDLLFLRPSPKIVRAAARPFELPSFPTIDRVGIDFLHTDMATPRLTTAAAMTWAPRAEINVIDVDRSQCDAFLARRKIVVEAEELRLCTGRGFVLIRHLGYGLGVGFLESTRPDDDNFGALRSMYPKAFAADLNQTSAFGNPS